MSHEAERAREDHVRYVELMADEGYTVGYTVDELPPVEHPYWQELADFHAYQDRPKLPARRGLEFRTLADVRSTRKPPEWLIKGFWLTDGFGVVGGAEKSLKSWTLLAAGIAVASGTPLFGSTKFPVMEPHNVMVLTGEGGADLTLDRIEHLSKMYEVDVMDRMVITDEIVSVESEMFKLDMQQAIDTHDPALVIVDPAYVYLNGDDAGNVFHMGRKLADLRDVCGRRAVMIGHHFTKTGKDDLTLASLTQAGFREAVDHWLLMRHAAPPDLDAQKFTLAARMGARRGFGWEATFNVTLGPFNEDTLQHDGTPSWEMTEGTPASATKERKHDVYNVLREAGRAMTARELAEIVLDDPEQDRKIRLDLGKLVKLGQVIKLKTARNEHGMWQVAPELVV